jgi:hypothetical protein
MFYYQSVLQINNPHLLGSENYCKDKVHKVSFFVNSALSFQSYFLTYKHTCMCTLSLTHACMYVHMCAHTHTHKVKM